MGGGLMQLVAYGAQDIYLTGNPQITFFKVVYRRHTNFSMECIEQTLNGSSTGVTDGATATCTVSRNGDLVHKVYVTSEEASVTNGSALVDEVELEIGGQRIDRHYKEWNDVWSELTTPESKAIALKAMQNDIGTSVSSATQGSNNLTQIPLNFWFCRNPGLALPLIALQYHEVKLKFTWKGVGTVGVAANPKVWCDYIYLDTDERRRFAQVSHEYLIEQLQKEDKTTTAGAKDYKLNFNHPVKELIWTYEVTEMLTDGKLVLNGHDRFAAQKEEHFSLRQPYDYHTAVPRQNLPSAAQLTSNYSELEPADSLGSGDLTTDAFPAVASTNEIDPPGSANNFALIVTDENYSAVTPTTARGTDDGDGTTTTVGNTSGAPQKVTETNWAAQTLTGKAAIQVDDATGAFWSQYEGRLIRLTGENMNTAVSGSATFADVVLNKVVLAANSSTSETGAINDGTLLYFNQNFLTFTAAGATSTTVTSAKAYLPKSEVVTQARTSKMTRKIGIYSFALKPEEHQPSGTCNFSRIDNATLNLNASAGSTTLSVYAVNYNVLRIMSGMGGLAYSN
jgi:hypothetical protein